MFRRIMAALLLTAPGAAAMGQGEQSGDWAIAQMPNGCMVEAVSPQGTMLTIWGFAGRPKLAFLLQNKEWGALQDGRSYQLSLDFVGSPTAVPVEATARHNIDGDGPGLLFTVQPGGDGTTNFLDVFTSAEGMRISQDGHKVDTLPLAGSRRAITALAQCLAAHWSSPSAQPDQSDQSDDAKAPAANPIV
ncbi:MAG TPA: hypothetical protein VGF77_13020 [Allosphingosinicella sp.]|jgi:hypothetical protein